MAADLGYGSPAVQSRAHASAGQYGPGFRMGNEPWHIEPVARQVERLGLAADTAKAGIGGMAKGAEAMGAGMQGFGASLPGLISGIGAQHGVGGTVLAWDLGQLGKALKIPGFASGGRHVGGWRIVGENGPELEHTGPATIFSSDASRAIAAKASAGAQAAPGSTVQNVGLGHRRCRDPPGRIRDDGSGAPSCPARCAASSTIPGLPDGCQLAAPGAADGSDLSPLIEISPNIRSGAAIDALVTLIKAACKAVIVPGPVKPGRRRSRLTVDVPFRWQQTLR